MGINATQALSIYLPQTAVFIRSESANAYDDFDMQNCYLDNRISVKYWQIQLTHNKSQVDFKSIRLPNGTKSNFADDTLKAIQRSAAATVTSVETKSSMEQPPLLLI